MASGATCWTVKRPLQVQGPGKPHTAAARGGRAHTSLHTQSRGADDKAHADMCARTLALARQPECTHFGRRARADTRAPMLTGTCRLARAPSYTRAAEEPSETSCAVTERRCYAQSERLQAHSPAHT